MRIIPGNQIYIDLIKKNYKKYKKMSLKQLPSVHKLEQVALLSEDSQIIFLDSLKIFRKQEKQLSKLELTAAELTRSFFKKKLIACVQLQKRRLAEEKSYWKRQVLDQYRSQQLPSVQKLEQVALLSEDSQIVFLISLKIYRKQKEQLSKLDLIAAQLTNSFLKEKLVGCIQLRQRRLAEEKSDWIKQMLDYYQSSQLPSVQKLEQEALLSEESQIIFLDSLKIFRKQQLQLSRLKHIAVKLTDSFLKEKLIASVKLRKRQLAEENNLLFSTQTIQSSISQDFQNIQQKNGSFLSTLVKIVKSFKSLFGLSENTRGYSQDTDLQDYSYFLFPEKQ